MDQPVPLNDDPVPPSTNQYPSPHTDLALPSTSQYRQVTNINNNNDNYNNT